MLQRVVKSSDCRRPKGTELSKFRHLDTAFVLVVIVVWLRAGKGSMGVGLAIKEDIVKKPGENGIAIEWISARLLKALISIKSNFVTFVVAYVQTEEAPEGQKAKYMTALNCTVASVPARYASMRGARRQGVLKVGCCGTRPSSRVRARAPPVQDLLRGGYKCGLHAFQGGQKHHGRFGTPEEEKGGGGAEGSSCRRVSPRDAALRHALR